MMGLGINAYPNYEGIMMPPVVYPTVDDSYDNPLGSGRTFPYRLQPSDDADTTCFCRYDTVTKITVTPRDMSVNAKPAIFVLNDAGEIVVPAGYTSISDYVSKRYEIVCVISMDDESHIFTRYPTPLLRNTMDYYKNLPAGRYADEISIATPEPEVNNNYVMNPIHGKAPVYVTRINWRDYRETIVYGDTISFDNVNLTYNGQNRTNFLQYTTSNRNVIAIENISGKYKPKVVGAGKATITIKSIFPTYSDSVKYDIAVNPYRGLRISAPIDTLPSYDPSVLNRYSVSGLRYNDEVAGIGNGANEISITTNAVPTSANGDYPINVCCYNNRNYTAVDYRNGSITIFKVGDSVQMVRYIRSPRTDVAVDNPRYLALWAKATGTIAQDTNISRPLRYSSSNGSVARIIRDTMGFDDDGTTPLWGAIVQIMGVGSVDIRAYQRGDSTYRDTFAIHTINVAQGRHAIQWLRYPDTLRVNGWMLLSEYTRSTSGLPVLFSINNSAAARISGDTLFGLRVGVVTITAKLPPNPNYIYADSITADCNITSNYFEISVQGEWLLPTFHPDTTKYTLMLPCTNNGSIVYATIRIRHNANADSLYCNGVFMTEDNIRISDTTRTKKLTFTISRNGQRRAEYSIALQRRIPGVMAQVWDDVLVLDLNRIANPPLYEDRLGYQIIQFQWYYSISTLSSRYLLSGAVMPYLELAKIPYTNGYYSAILTTSDSMLVGVCPFSLANYRPAVQQMIAYPNPVRDYVTIDNPQWEQSGAIFLYDLNGTLRRTYDAVEPPQTLDISGLQAGIYLIRAGGATIRITIL
jgi:hypothetical protein